MASKVWSFDRINHFNRLWVTVTFQLYKPFSESGHRSPCLPDTTCCEIGNLIHDVRQDDEICLIWMQGIHLVLIDTLAVPGSVHFNGWYSGKPDQITVDPEIPASSSRYCYCHLGTKLHAVRAVSHGCIIGISNPLTPFFRIHIK